MSYYFIILFNFQNSIFIKILFFNISLLFLFKLVLFNRHFFFRFGIIPTAPPSPITTPHLHLYGSIVINHHTTTSTAPPSSITTPPPKCFSLTASASHHTHYTIRKPKPISAGPQPLMNAEELINPDTATARSIFPP